LGSPSEFSQKNLSGDSSSLCYSTCYFIPWSTQ